MNIPFISEEIIDHCSDRLSDTDKYYTDAIENMKNQQPILLSYLLSENFRMLTQEEKDYMLYLALVIWESVQQVQISLGGIETEDIEAKEEINWQILNESKARMFKERLDGFFKNTKQEDLLAFVEDALVEDEEEQIVTKEGKELLFIGLKTVIDCLCD